MDLLYLAGDILLNGKAAERKLQRSFKQLVDDAVFIFNDEDALKAKHAVAVWFLEAFIKQQAEF